MLLSPQNTIALEISLSTCRENMFLRASRALNKVELSHLGCKHLCHLGTRYFFEHCLLHNVCWGAVEITQWLTAVPFSQFSLHTINSPVSISYIRPSSTLSSCVIQMMIMVFSQCPTPVRTFTLDSSVRFQMSTPSLPAWDVNNLGYSGLDNNSDLHLQAIHLEWC